MYTQSHCIQPLIQLCILWGSYPLFSPRDVWTLVVRVILSLATRQMPFPDPRSHRFTVWSQEGPSHLTWSGTWSQPVHPAIQPIVRNRAQDSRSPTSYCYLHTEREGRVAMAWYLRGPCTEGGNWRGKISGGFLPKLVHNKKLEAAGWYAVSVTDVCWSLDFFSTVFNSAGIASVPLFLMWLFSIQRPCQLNWVKDTGCS